MLMDDRADLFNLVKLYSPLQGIIPVTSPSVPLPPSTNLTLAFRFNDEGEAQILQIDASCYWIYNIEKFASFQELCFAVYLKLDPLTTEATPKLIEELSDAIYQQLAGLLFIQEQYNEARRLLGLK